jgi:hypothetical protein
MVARGWNDAQIFGAKTKAVATIGNRAGLNGTE